MTILLWILLTLIVFTIVVFIHELGHFSIARLFRVKVEEFGLWIPPKAKTLFQDKKWTEYTLNWIPLGGFVRLKWEDSLDENPEKDSFAWKGWFAKSSILLAWVSMNFVLTWILFIGLFFMGSTPFWVNVFFKTDTHTKLLPTMEDGIQDGSILVGDIIFSPLTGSVAYNAGIREDDVLVSVNSWKVQTTSELTEIIQKSKKVSLEINRSWSYKTFTLEPNYKKIGAYLWYNSLKLTEIKADNLLDAIYLGTREFKEHFLMTAEMLGDFFRKIFFPKDTDERKKAIENISWPIGLGNLFVGMIDMKVGINIILIVIALISLNLGFFNLLPLPALDGGRFVTVTISHILTFLWVSKIRLLSGERIIHIFWFLFLILLSILVAFEDIRKIFFQ